MRRISIVLMIGLALPLIGGEVRAQSQQQLTGPLRAAFEGLSRKIPEIPAGPVAVVLDPRAHYASQSVEELVSTLDRARRVGSTDEIIRCSPDERAVGAPCRFEGVASVVKILGIEGEGRRRVVRFVVSLPVRSRWGVVSAGYAVTVEHTDNSWLPTRVELVWIS